MDNIEEEERRVVGRRREAIVDLAIPYSEASSQILAPFSCLSTISFFRSMVVTTVFLFGLFAPLLGLCGAIVSFSNKKQPQNTGERCCGYDRRRRTSGGAFVYKQPPVGGVGCLLRA